MPIDPTSFLFLSESVAGSVRACASRPFARQTLSPFLGFGRRRHGRRRRRATVKSFRCSPPPLRRSPVSTRATLHRRQSHRPRTNFRVSRDTFGGHGPEGAHLGRECQVRGDSRAFSPPIFIREVVDRPNAATRVTFACSCTSVAADNDGQFSLYLSNLHPFNKETEVGMYSFFVARRSLVRHSVR